MTALSASQPHRMFKRQAVAYVNDVRVEDLRMQFKTERHTKKDPNTLELSIHNLSQSTLGRIQTRNATVLFAAGYDGQLCQLFKGTARSVLPSKEGTNWVTKIQCGDGLPAFGYGRANQSFAPGTGITDVLGGLAKSVGVGMGNALAAFKKGGVKDGFATFAHGFTSSGDAAGDIDTIVRGAGFTWSIQDGELLILTSTQDTIGQQEVISPDSGLIGSPEVGGAEKKGQPALLKFKCKLRPQLMPGSPALVQSRGFKGQVRCENVTHEGDTQGGDWMTSVEARAQ